MHAKPELLELLRTHRLRLDKRLGQHYFIDPPLARRLVERCGFTGTETVVEIGAGLGAFTELLAEVAKTVLAVEVDRDICEVLKARLASRSNVTVLRQDILAFRWEDVPGATVFGAIPYQITSPILVNLFGARRHVLACWLGIQREVAERLTAPPNTKAYGRLSVLAQYGWRVSEVARIPRHAFFPQPDVDSVWLNLAPHTSPPVSVMDEALFFQIVQAAFSHRRKTLMNCLLGVPALGLSRPQAAALLAGLGLSQTIRGEALSLQDLAELANRLVREKSLR